jgi:alanyl-tRNA synthetase
VLGLLREKDAQLRQIMNMVKASAPAELPIKIEKMQAAEKDLRKSLESQSRKSAAGDLDRWIADAAPVKEGKFIRGVVQLSDGENPSKALRDLADLIRSKVQKSIVALGASDAAKGQHLLLVAVTKDLTEKVKANDLIRQVAPVIEGTGGGKPDLAQAGGKNAKFSEAFREIEKLLC